MDCKQAYYLLHKHVNSMRKYLLSYFPSIPQHLDRVLPWTQCSINIYWIINEEWMFQNWNNSPYEEGIKIASHACTCWVVLTQTCSLRDCHLSSVFAFKLRLLCILYISEILKYTMFHYDSECLISPVIQKKRKKKTTLSRQKANRQGEIVRVLWWKWHFVKRNG